MAKKKRKNLKGLPGSGSAVPTLPIEYRLLIGAVGLVTITGIGYYVLVKPIQQLKENASQNQAANQDSPAGVAAEIWAAAHTGLWGATEDEERIVKAAKKIPGFAFYTDVIKAYRAQHPGRELEEDLVWWLSDDEYQEFKSIIAQNQALL